MGHTFTSAPIIRFGTRRAYAATRRIFGVIRASGTSLGVATGSSLYSFGDVVADRREQRVTFLISSHVLPDVYPPWTTVYPRLSAILSASRSEGSVTPAFSPYFRRTNDRTASG